MEKEVLRSNFKKYAPVAAAVILLTFFVNISYYLVNSHLLQTADAYSEYSQYTVKYGDSLFTISKKYGISIKEIKNANALKSDVIMPGQILKIRVPAAGSRINRTSLSGRYLKKKE